MRFEHFHRVTQQVGRATTPGHGRRTGCQGHKRMQVRGFAGVAVLGMGSGELATVFGIAQWPGERCQAVIDQRRAAWQPLDMGEGEAVNHACGGYGVCWGIIRALAESVQAGKAVRHAGGLGEVQ